MLCCGVPADTFKEYLASIEINKIKIFGWGYVKDTCIALFKKQQEEKATRLYYAECLRIITENTAKMCEGSYITIKLDDIINPKPVEIRTSDEIINGIKIPTMSNPRNPQNDP